MRKVHLRLPSPGCAGPKSVVFGTTVGLADFSAQIAFKFKQDLGIVVLYNRLDFNPWRPRKPRFTDRVYAAVVKLLFGLEPIPLPA
jgi:hypothetical protein